jgi:hypothetical protein
MAIHDQELTIRLNTIVYYEPVPIEHIEFTVGPFKPGEPFDRLPNDHGIPWLREES